MMTILEVFYKDIPAIVFEPLAVLGWCGLVLALISFRKERSVLYLTVTFSLVFMILWRMVIQIISARYAQILIFPMTAAAAFFIFQLEHLRRIFPAVPEKYVKCLPVCILGILTVVCILKNLNYNTYTPVMDISRLVREDRVPGKAVIYTMDLDRLRQIEYYSGKEVHHLKPFPKNYDRVLTPALCRQIMAQAAENDAAETVYIFAVSAGKKAPIAAKEVGMSDAAWRLFAEKPFNRKGKRVFRVYKCSLKNPAVSQ
ncbi:MAG: hypothetical protein IKC65_02105 [Lentisphaeria bacterium]|nr:hypothetical protein [Lentisphaeria bacterium]